MKDETILDELLKNIILIFEKLVLVIVIFLSIAIINTRLYKGYNVIFGDSNEIEKIVYLDSNIIWRFNSQVERQESSGGYTLASEIKSLNVLKFKKGFVVESYTIGLAGYKSDDEVYNNMYVPIDFKDSKYYISIDDNDNICEDKYYTYNDDGYMEEYDISESDVEINYDKESELDKVNEYRNEINKYEDIIKGVTVILNIIEIALFVIIIVYCVKYILKYKIEDIISIMLHILVDVIFVLILIPGLFCIYMNCIHLL